MRIYCLVSCDGEFIQSIFYLDDVMTTYEKRQNLKRLLLMEAEAKAHQSYKQKDIDILLNEKPRIYLAAKDGVLINE